MYYGLELFTYLVTGNKFDKYAHRGTTTINFFGAIKMRKFEKKKCSDSPGFLFTRLDRFKSSVLSYSETQPFDTFMSYS